MSLIQTVATLVGRELTTEEITSLANFQRLEGIDDSDPLITVLALMAKSHMIMETLPEKLQKAAVDTIDLHQRTLREQSTILAKDLIVTVLQDLKSAQSDWKSRWMTNMAWFVAGSLLTAIAINIASR